MNAGLSKSYIYFVYNAWLLLSKVSGKYTKYCEWNILTVVDTVKLGSKVEESGMYIMLTRLVLTKYNDNCKNRIYGNG